MKKFYLILTIFFCLGCSKKIEKYTPSDPTGISIKMSCDKTKYKKTNKILFKLYYSHDTNEISKENDICEFKLMLLGSNEKYELFSTFQTGSEFFDIKNYSEATSKFFFFARPTYNSYYDVEVNFIDFADGDYILKYSLDIKSEVDYLSYSVEFNLNIVDETIYIYK